MNAQCSARIELPETMQDVCDFAKARSGNHGSDFWKSFSKCVGKTGIELQVGTYIMVSW